ncbi:MAG: diguanylate cyclase [Treponema sp.]|nr:diguanylate cyclase [Treponema sp.]
MKQRSITVYSIIISVILAAGIIFFGYSIGYEYKTSGERTGKQFDSFVHSIRTALASYEVTSDNFKNALEKACGNFDDYAFITLKNNSHILYAYPSIETATTMNASRLCRLYTSSFSTGDVAYIVTASMYLLRPSLIFYYARFSFLIILAATAFTIILIVYLHVSNPDAKADYADMLHESEYELGSENSSETANDFSADSTVNRTDVYEEYTDENSPYSLAAHTSDEHTTKNNTEETATPQGLFSPATGLSWEQYLEVRLDSELIRAASSEQDLSLFLLRIPSLSFADSIAARISAYLSEQFQYNDLLFEYASDGFAIIKENTAIDEALIIADTVYASVSKLLKDANAPLSCAIGISSRSVRMLPGKRLLKEAEEALENALHDAKNPIVAFRANADKYRKLISE